MERLLLAKDSYSAYRKIDLRVSDERRGSSAQSPVLQFAPDELEELSEKIKTTQQLVAMIQTLRVQKLKLLNDYDFTHGDNTDQIAVFGPVPEVTVRNNP